MSRFIGFTLKFYNIIFKILQMLTACSRFSFWKKRKPFGQRHGLGRSLRDALKAAAVLRLEKRPQTEPKWFQQAGR